MYYKVIKDNKVIDVLDNIHYLKYSQRKKQMFNAEGFRDAQAFLSSDEKHIWHANILKEIPVDGYDTVELVQIDVYEYEQLKCLNLKTAQEIIDEYTLLLLEGGIL